MLTHPYTMLRTLLENLSFQSTAKKILLDYMLKRKRS